MSLRTAQKMYLISLHQFKRLTTETSIRQMVEEDLDSKMREILNEPGLSSYEKIKKIQRSAAEVSGSDETRSAGRTPSHTSTAA